MSSVYKPSKEEKDIFKLFKENGIMAPWKKRFTSWGWVLSELDQIIHQRDFYKKKYDEMKQVIEGRK